jgi:surfactin synthase thioesterase subunit
LEKLLPFRTKRERPRVRLVCFPFAGGAATVYRPWGNRFPDHVDVCPVELPGRGTRFGEPRIQDPDALLAELAPLSNLGDLPTVYFGHSMGGRIAFALAHGGMRVDALIVSGSRPAHIAQPKIRSTLDRAALVQELERLGGTPRAIMDDADMLDLMLPLVRADFRILEALLARPEDKVTCPLVALAATDDREVSLAESERWEVHAGGKYRLEKFDGGHFFLSTRLDKVLGEVQRVIDETLAI